MDIKTVSGMQTSVDMIIFESLLTPSEVRRFFVAGEIANVGLSLIPNHHNKVKLLKIPNTHCRNKHTVIYGKSTKFKIFFKFNVFKRQGSKNPFT